MGHFGRLCVREPREILESWVQWNMETIAPGGDFRPGTLVAKHNTPCLTDEERKPTWLTTTNLNSVRYLQLQCLSREGMEEDRNAMRHPINVARRILRVSGDPKRTL
jgi:hypothetical protein